MQSAVDDEPSVTEQSDEAAARKFAWENCIELAASDTVLEKHTEVAGIISDQCSQVVGEVYALPLTLAQHDNQLVLAYSPLDSTVAMENAGEIQPLSSSNVVHSEAAVPRSDNDAVVFSSSDADDDNVFDVDYVPDSAESCSSEISIENSIKQFLPLSNTRATDHSVPYSSGGNIVVSGEHNGSDDMNACNSTDSQQNTEGDSQSSLPR